MAESTIGALDNLATATAADRSVVATLPEANARLVKKQEENSNELREFKALIRNERFESLGNAVSILHQKHVAGPMAKKSPVLTQV
jgi:hypothetical protein